MAWNISGQYFETCNCDYLCPCVITGLAETTHGFCAFAMAYRVDEGEFNGVDMRGVKFMVIGKTPGAMGEGNWEVGVIVDDAASQEQTAAIGAIASGQSGGPLANIAPLISKVLGLEQRPIEFTGSDGSWSVKVPELVDQGVEGTRGIGGELLYLDNVGHPANNRLGLARATHSRIHAFGINFEDVSGKNNGQFAPFRWSGN